MAPTDLIWIVVGLLVVVLAGIAWVAFRTRSPADPPAANHRTVAPGQTFVREEVKTWGKTLIVPNPAEACPAVLIIQGQSFRNEDAPRLPLTGCGSTNCKCHYVPAREMRTGKERRSGIDRRSSLRYEPGKPDDRRSGKDRRKHGRYDWEHPV